MPKYEVVLIKTVVETLCVEVSAKDDATAEEKVQAVMKKISDPDKLAKHYKAEWVVDSEDVEIDNVNEL